MRNEFIKGCWPIFFDPGQVVYSFFLLNLHKAPNLYNAEFNAQNVKCLSYGQMPEDPIEVSLILLQFLKNVTLRK